MQHRRHLLLILCLGFTIISKVSIAQQTVKKDTTHKTRVSLKNTKILKDSTSGSVNNTTRTKKYTSKKTTGPNSDALLKSAKVAAFKENNYPKAKTILYKALKRSPNYPDVKIFLGRIYGWTDNYDSAKYFFQSVLKRNPSNEDATVAYADLEYYLDHYTTADSIVLKGLKYNRKSKDLLLRKAKIQKAIKNPGSVRTTANKVPVIKIPGNTTSKVSGGKTDTVASVAKNDLPGNEPVTRLSDTTGNAPPSKDDKVFEDKLNLTLTNAPPVVKQQPPVQNSAGQTSSLPNATTQNNGTTAILDTSSSDDLIALARKAVFDEKNYEKGKGYLYRALKKSPTYADVQIFLGRIYTWTNNYDSAKYFFDSALRLKPEYEDAINAYTDLEYWNDHYHPALALVEGGLRYHPASEDLLLRKAKILTALKDYKNAQLAVNELLRIDYKNAEAIALRERLKELAAKNSFSLGYDFAYFNKQFDAPWHLVSAEYGRVTDLGKVIGRVNFANRFVKNGAQFELDAYPHISKTFYAYMNVGVPLTNVGIFPLFRAGFSLYANLPAAFEAELGFRYLQFSGNPVIIYTAYLGKYYKNWLFSERVYLVPSDFSQTISASFSGSASYYIGGSSSDDVIGATVGYGISPDDRANNIQINTNVERLGSYKAALFYKKKVSKFDVLSISQGIYVSEYLPGVHGNEFDFGISFLHRF